MFGRNRNNPWHYERVTKAEYLAADVCDGSSYRSDERALHDIESPDCVCQPELHLYATNKIIEHNPIANYLSNQSNDTLKEILKLLKEKN